MYRADESEAKVAHKEPLFIIGDYFYDHFHKRALVEDNTASDCIRIVAATYSCKILQLYEYEANEYVYEGKCE